MGATCLSQWTSDAFLGLQETQGFPHWLPPCPSGHHARLGCLSTRAPPDAGPGTPMNAAEKGQPGLLDLGLSLQLDLLVVSQQPGKSQDALAAGQEGVGGPSGLSQPLVRN